MESLGDSSIQGILSEHLRVSDTVLSTMGITVSSMGENHAFKEDSLLGENHKSSGAQIIGS